MPVSFQPFDVVILTLLAFTTFQGLRRGLIRSIFDIVAFFCAIALAMTWQGELARFLTETFHWGEPLPHVLSFFAVWIATYLVINLIGGGLHRLIRSSIFGPLNFLSGGLIGLIKGTLLVALFLQFIFTLPLPRNLTRPIQASQAVQWIMPVAKMTYPYLFKSSAYLFPQGIPLSPQTPQKGAIPPREKSILQ